MLDSQQKDLLISGYIRDQEFESMIDRVIPNEIIFMIALFYPIYIEFEGSSIKLTMDAKQIITSWLNKQILDKNKSNNKTVLNSTLLYNGNRDGFEAKPYTY